MKTLAFAFLLFATTVIDIDTSTLTDEPQTWEMGNRRVTADKSGDTTIVTVAEGGRVDTLTIRTVEGKPVITHSDNGVARPFLFTERAYVMVDGIDLEPFLTGHATGPRRYQLDIEPPPTPRRYTTGPRYYLCPKDEALLRVPHAEPGQVFKCPVDGTEMKAGVGADRKIWLLH